MRASTALYQWLLPQTKDEASPLFGASLFRSLRGSVDSARKVIRVDCYNGLFVRSSGVAPAPEEQERNVRFIIQCFVSPDAASPSESELLKLEEAKDEAFLMARTIFQNMADEDNWLQYGVCTVYGDEFENTEETLGTTLRAVTYFFGEVNR